MRVEKFKDFLSLRGLTLCGNFCSIPVLNGLFDWTKGRLLCAFLNWLSRSRKLNGWLPILVTNGISAGLLFLLLMKEQGVAIENHVAYYFVEIKEYMQINIIDFDKNWDLIGCTFCGEQIGWIKILASNVGRLCFSCIVDLGLPCWLQHLCRSWRLDIVINMGRLAGRVIGANARGAGCMSGEIIRF